MNPDIKKLLHLYFLSFATQNLIKKKTTVSQKAETAAESVRDMFVRIKDASDYTILDLKMIMTYPITTYPLLLAHCDGTHIKTHQSALPNKLESFQTELMTDGNVPASYTQIYDARLLQHSPLSLTVVGSSKCRFNVVCIAWGRVLPVCSRQGCNHCI